MNHCLACAEAYIRAAYDHKPTHQTTLLVAIDGRCASGKTTLAAALGEALSDIGCSILHMDDYFLRPEQRTPERLAKPGENIDHERFLSEVLKPLSEGKPFQYIPFSCRCQKLLDPVAMNPTPIVVMEGSYACHPSLRSYYDVRFFLSVDPETQMRRIASRNGNNAEAFRTRWIPLEEVYIAAHAPQAVCICLP